ncbi:MAG: hypothetical protein C4575_10660 [Desulforudis sp.]|nr:MAG: hypothetical protein C4575_10660 [Desulforudis sp.]
MALLNEEDYKILQEAGLNHEEDQAQRFLILKNFPLSGGLYSHNGQILYQVEVLWIAPTDYNTSGGDMFWVHPALVRTDGKTIPNISVPGGADPRHYNSKEYCRWSRHWAPTSWKPKIDNIQKVLDRIEWALKKPDAR